MPATTFQVAIIMTRTRVLTTRILTREEVPPRGVREQRLGAGPRAGHHLRHRPFEIIRSRWRHMTIRTTARHPVPQIITGRFSVSVSASFFSSGDVSLVLLGAHPFP